MVGEGKVWARARPVQIAMAKRKLSVNILLRLNMWLLQRGRYGIFRQGCGRLGVKKIMMASLATAAGKTSRAGTEMRRRHGIEIHIEEIVAVETGEGTGAERL